MYLKQNQQYELSRQEREFLINFSQNINIECRNLDYFNGVLQENIHNTCNKFLRMNLIYEENLIEKLVNSYKVSELKSFLRDRSQKISGLKYELASLVANFPNDEFVQKINKETIYTLTEKGKEITHEYLDFKNNEKQNCENQVMSYLSKKDFKSACLEIANFETNQVFSRGINVNWNSYNPSRDIEILSSIYSEVPKIIHNLDKSLLSVFQNAAAMMHLWGVNKAWKWVPPNIKTNLQLENDTIARMFLFNAISKKELAEIYQLRSIVKVIRIVGDVNSCENCRKLREKEYTFDNIPALPYEHCSCQMGCRCSYSAAISK